MLLSRWARQLSVLVSDLVDIRSSPQELAHQIEDSRVSMIFVDPALLPILKQSFMYLSPAVRTKLCIDAPIGVRLNVLLISEGYETDVDGMQTYESLIGKETYEAHVCDVNKTTAMMCKSSSNVHAALADSFDRRLFIRHNRAF